MNRHPLDPFEIPSENSPSGHSTGFPRRSLPPYRVVLLQNADKNMMFVIRTVMELTRFCRTEATHKMWQAHYFGRADLVVTHRERAELFVELFANRGLQATIEPNF